MSSEDRHTPKWALVDPPDEECWKAAVCALKIFDRTMEVTKMDRGWITVFPEDNNNLRAVNFKGRRGDEPEMQFQAFVWQKSQGVMELVSIKCYLLGTDPPIPFWEQVCPSVGNCCKASKVALQKDIQTMEVPSTDVTWKQDLPEESYLVALNSKGREHVILVQVFMWYKSKAHLELLSIKDYPE